MAEKRGEEPGPWPTRSDSMCSEKVRSVYQRKLSDATVMEMEGEEEEGEEEQRVV